MNSEDERWRAGSSETGFVRTFGYYAGKEPIPLVGNKTRDLGTPNINIANTNEGVVAGLSGRIDIDFAPALRRQLLALIEARTLQTISIDLSQIAHIDSSGIATLIEALKIARTKKTALRLQGMNARLLRLLEVTGILPLFNGHDEMNSPGNKAV